MRFARVAIGTTVTEFSGYLISKRQSFMGPDVRNGGVFEYYVYKTWRVATFQRNFFCGFAVEILPKCI